MLQFDFNDASDWPQRIAAGAEATIEAKNVGTIDGAGVKDASGGLLLLVKRTETHGEWVAALNSGPLAVQNNETHLGKLTLSFILLMDGTYAGDREIVDFRCGGTPAAWITLKNYPGHQPVLRSTAWNIIKIGRGSPGRPSSNVALAYLEVRGLQVGGNSDEVHKKYAADIGKSKSTTNGNGISVDGRYETTNTAWMNSASPELQYAQIFAQDCDDVRIVNNILVAPVANVSAGEKPETINGAGRCSHFVFTHNLYFGGNQRPLMGENDRIADPLSVNPSTDPTKADFRLKSGGPALKAGRLESFSPIADLEAKLRPPNGPADLGAFQK